MGMKRWSPVILCLLAASLAARPGTLYASSPAESKHATRWPTEERGFGVTVNEAKNDAVKHLTKQLAAILREHDPPLYCWQATPDYVKDHLIVGDGEAGSDFVVENIGATKTWIYKVKGLDWSALIGLDREAQRSSRRLNQIIFGGQLFGGLALLLAVIAVSSRRAKRSCIVTPCFPRS
jgi:hypothetical protein